MISIDILPDEVILGIFYSYLLGYLSIEEKQNAWHLLVHVCRRWRTIVFGSPRHLNLQLICTARTQARKMLDVWPALPIYILCMDPAENVDNIIAVLERTDRVYAISMDIRSSERSNWEILLAAMQQPFPGLRSLGLYHDKTALVVPDSILGGSAPRLLSVYLYSILFLGLQKLLLSATHLITLSLWRIPHSGYLSPDALVITLSTLTSLETLVFGFESPRSCPDRESKRPPPSTRTILPVLKDFRFQGVSEYLEDFVACIDAPQLNHLDIIFFHDVVFDTPQLIHLISRTPKLIAPKKAHIFFQDRAARLIFSSQKSPASYAKLRVTISCRGLDWQVSSLEQICTSCSPFLSTLEDLYIFKCTSGELNSKGKVENRLWPELLHSFTAVKNLYLSRDFAQYIAPAFQELLEGRTAEVLTALHNIFLEGFDSSRPVEEGIGQFVSARQVAGHPITISRWTGSAREKFLQGVR